MKLKPIFFLSVSLSVVACGGSSNKSDDTLAGNCINVPRPMVGQKITLERSRPNEGVISIETEATTAVSDTSASYDITFDQNIFGSSNITTGDLEFTFNIANNYRNISKLETNLLTSNTTINLVNEYSPLWKTAYDMVCEGQTWTSNSVVTTTSTSDINGSVTNSTMTSNQNLIYTIESIDVQKVVRAGTFSTFQIRQEDGNSIDTIWFDKATGLWVIAEGSNTNGEITETTELISIEQL